MPIIGRNIFLRRLDEADVGEDYLNWMNDPQVTQYLSGSHGQAHTLESLRAFVSTSNASPLDHLFGIFLKADSKHIGNVKIGSIRKPHLSADIGLMIGRRTARGKGYGTEAIVLATLYAFEGLRLNKLWAGVYANNLGAYQAFIKAGYREVGRFQRHILFNGHYIDSILVERCNDKTDSI